MIVLIGVFEFLFLFWVAPSLCKGRPHTVNIERRIAVCLKLSFTAVLFG